MRHQTLTGRFAVFTAGLAVAAFSAVPAEAQKGGAGSRGANFARGMMSSGGGGGGGRGAGGGGSRAMSGGGNRSGGNRGMASGGPGGGNRGGNRGGGAVVRGGNGGNRGGNFRGGGFGGRPGVYYGGGRGRSGVAIGIYGSGVGLTYGAGRYGGLGNGSPYYGVYPGYARYGYGYGVPGYRYRVTPQYVPGVYGYNQPNPGYVVEPNQQGPIQQAQPNAVYQDGSQVVTSRVVVPETSAGPVVATSANAAAYQAEAETALRDNRIEDAVRAAGHAVIEDAQNGRVHLFASQALFAAGDYTDSADALRTGVSLLPEEDWGHVIQNYKRFYRGSNYVEQMNRMIQFIKDNPNSADAITLRGYHYRYLGYPEAAEKQLSNAMEINPGDPLPEMLLATMNRSLPGPPEQAVQAEVLEELPPGNGLSTTDDRPADPVDDEPSDEGQAGELDAETDADVGESILEPPKRNPPPIPTPGGN